MGLTLETGAPSIDNYVVDFFHSVNTVSFNKINIPYIPYFKF